MAEFFMDDPLLYTAALLFALGMYFAIQAIRGRDEL